MTPPPAVPPARVRMGVREWLIVTIAAIGFAFDIYELLMMPLIGRPAIAELLGTFESDPVVRDWFNFLLYAPAVPGGIFGLLGGYLADYFGRRRVLVFSILLYALSALAAGFAADIPGYPGSGIWVLLVLRCTTFIGVCVEFVAATAWLAELFPEHRQRERVLGYTQAFSSVGGLMVSATYLFIVANAQSFPAIYGANAPWRYMLISGVIPALPLILIRPFLPESPVWQEKKNAGTLQRPSLAAIFSPRLRRTTVVTTVLFACCYGAAFGAIQQMPQIVPGLVPEEKTQIDAARKGYGAARAAYTKAQAEGADEARLQELRDQQRAADKEVSAKSKPVQEKVGRTQLLQELGGLAGRFALALLVAGALSRQGLLRGFIVPGVFIAPLVFWLAGTGRMGENSLTILQFGIFVVGFLTVAQFSFFGNYLPSAYPVHLRGTGEGFAANVGGRLIGTSAALATSWLAARMSAPTTEAQTAMAAGVVVLVVYVTAWGVSYFLPEPNRGRSGEFDGAE